MVVGLALCAFVSLPDAFIGLCETTESSCRAAASQAEQQAKQAAKLLTELATKCVRGANKRSTPTELLGDLEAVAGDFIGPYSPTHGAGTPQYVRTN